MKILAFLFICTAAFLILSQIDNTDVTGTDLDYEAEEIKDEYNLK